MVWGSSVMSGFSVVWGTSTGSDGATSVVWGMPGAVAQAGLCHAVLPLPRIAAKLLELLRMGHA